MLVSLQLVHYAHPIVLLAPRLPRRVQAAVQASSFIIVLAFLPVLKVNIKTITKYANFVYLLANIAQQYLSARNACLLFINLMERNACQVAQLAHLFIHIIARLVVAVVKLVILQQ